ncbi:MAG: peptidylprolyl isomerase [Bacteroidaceae bacterium]|nr:peptidylprolyl isomerase [Bacteroidaceae bacterium]
MKKVIIILVTVFVSVCSMAQDDPVIMVINGQNVPRSEFEYSFNKNNSEGVIDKKSVEDYVDLFINYKLKVCAALDAQLDTLSSYQEEFHQYRNQQLLPSFLSENDMDKEALKVYESTKKSIGPDGLIRPAHIFVHLPQNATADAQVAAKVRADSIYNALLEGADFTELAKQVSDDKSNAQKGGLLPWMSHGQSLEEFDKAAFALQVGEMSAPVLSSVGYHIIKMTDRKQLEPFEEVKPQIMKFLESRNAGDVVAQRNADSLAQEKGITVEELMDARAAELSAKDSNMKYLIQEYHDGLLLYEVSNRNVWEPASKDEKGLEDYFNAHKADYTWDEPYFKGIVYHVKNKADRKAVKKTIKKLPFDKWAEVLKEKFNNDSIFRVRAEKGLFKKGTNAWADKIVFKDAKAKPREVKGYPITDSFGKMLKAPEDYTDVKAQVVSDYQAKKEKEWIEGLRTIYTFEVNDEILKTVNNH